jgi:eukaryotic-like serine/threonine-protein kinase
VKHAADSVSPLGSSVRGAKVATPEELMLHDLEQRYRRAEVSPAFTRLYPEPGAISRMFADFHQRLNGNFEFMNQKSQTNRHFNAAESRDLMAVIQEIRNAQEVMALVGRGFKLADHYLKVITSCDEFLVMSGGSPIPDDFELVRVVKYEPVFLDDERTIRAPLRLESLPLKMIGEGSYARVYRYVDPEYDVPIALKRAKRELSSQDLARFKSEFDVLRSLRSPYVLAVYRYSDERNEYTMEHCDANLRQFIDRHNAKLTFGTRKRIVLQFLYGMNYLHSKGHLHRDVSYQNVLVKQYDGMAVLLKLSDFGLHKGRDSDFTRTESELRGTILDPTIRSFKEYGVVNEIYSVGFVMSFIFSGRLDIGACRGAIKPIIDRCVDLDNSARYPNVLSIIRDVEELQPPPTSADQASA